jgi:tryptophan-rich sensory protein
MVLGRQTLSEAAEAAAVVSISIRYDQETMSRTRQWIGLIVWVAISFGAAATGAQVTDPVWYQSLRKPDWAPPAWVFGPVWTALYLCMGIAAWLVWRRKGFAGARLALSLFLLQLVFNAAWTWIFFGLRRPGLAFAEIVVLWGLILATAVAFTGHHRVAAWLLAPYLLWVTYAAMLNGALWQLGA